MNPLDAYLYFSWVVTVGVVFDARRFDWSTNGFCDRWWKWVIGCTFLFGIAFPAYVWQRRKMPRREEPVGEQLTLLK